MYLTVSMIFPHRLVLSDHDRSLRPPLAWKLRRSSKNTFFTRWPSQNHTVFDAIMRAISRSRRRTFFHVASRCLVFLKRNRGCVCPGRFRSQLLFLLSTSDCRTDAFFLSVILFAMRDSTDMYRSTYSVSFSTERATGYFSMITRLTPEMEASASIAAPLIGFSVTTFKQASSQMAASSASTWRIETS